MGVGVWFRGAAGGGPPRQQGVCVSAVSSHMGTWGGAPEAFTLYSSNPAKN